MDKNYGGIIWTNHALARMHERGISQGDAWATWKRPDNSRMSKTSGTWIYYRTFGKNTVEVVAKQNEKKEWIVLSVWSKERYDRRNDQDQSLWKLMLSELSKFFKKTSY